MSQSHSAVFLHLIFSTKNREPFLRERSPRDEVHADLGGISKRIDCQPIIVGGVADHVHVLARQGRGVTQSDWVKEIKRVSSHWIKGRGPEMKHFAWQSGFGIFSVSPSKLDAVEHYIATQEEHHRTTTFQDEYRTFLKKHGVEWDERYVWD